MLERKINNKFKYLTLLSVLVLMSACDKQVKVDDGYIPEFAAIDSEEQCEHHLFLSDSNFSLSKATIAEIETLLKDTRATGIDNIDFMIISNTPVSIETQIRVKEQIKSLMYKHGFIRSRIIDKGVCVYKDAKPGVRIGILQYKAKEPNCDIWSEYIGDTDTNKNLPKYGVSHVYNLEEMIANKADFSAPREYQGARVSDAISAISSTGGGGGSGGGGS